MSKSLNGIPRLNDRDNDCSNSRHSRDIKIVKQPKEQEEQEEKEEEPEEEQKELREPVFFALNVRIVFLIQ